MFQHTAPMQLSFFFSLLSLGYGSIPKEFKTGHIHRRLTKLFFFTSYQVLLAFTLFLWIQMGRHIYEHHLMGDSQITDMHWLFLLLVLTLLYENFFAFWYLYQKEDLHGMIIIYMLPRVWKNCSHTR